MVLDITDNEDQLICDPLLCADMTESLLREILNESGLFNLSRSRDVHESWVGSPTQAKQVHIQKLQFGVSTCFLSPLCFSLYNNSSFYQVPPIFLAVRINFK